MRTMVSSRSGPVEMIAMGAPVSASNRVGAHLAARRYLYVLPKIGKAEWIVLDTADRWLPDDRLPALVERSQAEIDALRARIDADPAWRRVLVEDGVYVFRRTGD